MAMRTYRSSHRTNRARQGLGTVRRYMGLPDGITIIGLEKRLAGPLGDLAVKPDYDPFDEHSTPRSGQTSFLTLDPELAQQLTARYGRRQGWGVSLEALIGLPCRWTESACGMIVGLEPLAN